MTGGRVISTRGLRSVWTEVMTTTSTAFGIAVACDVEARRERAVKMQNLNMLVKDFITKILFPK